MTKKVMSGLSELRNMSAPEAAKRLLGCVLERELDEKAIRVQIVETEAYDQTDAASHSFIGRTPRTHVLFGPAGHLYVYFTYGKHYCCNIVVGEEGDGAAVLIRAVEPLGEELMLEKRRGGKVGIELTNGPAKLCQALSIDRKLNGHDLRYPPLRLVIRPILPSAMVIRTTRVGVRLAKDMPWRFYVRNNPYVSRH